MLVIPAVDIRGGKCVRLLRGRSDAETVYGNDPVEAALKWDGIGARRIHVVDLDGAFEGRPLNSDHVRRIIESVSAEVEVGGGLRSVEAVGRIIGMGAARAIVGTRAISDREFLEDIVSRFPGQVSVALDVKSGRLASHGWKSASGVRPEEFLESVRELPLAEVIYTDVSRDGTLEGPDIEGTTRIAGVSAFPVIAAGGVKTIEDVRALARAGVFGVVVGKSLYEGTLDLAAALAETDSVTLERKDEADNG